MDMITEAAAMARESVRVVSSNQLCSNPIDTSELGEPFVCHDAHVAGMQVPAVLSQDARHIADHVGPEKLVSVVRLCHRDVKVMSLSDWASDFDLSCPSTPNLEMSHSMNSVSINIDSCNLAHQVQFPSFVRRLDWGDQGLDAGIGIKRSGEMQQEDMNCYSVNSLTGFHGGGLFGAQLAMTFGANSHNGPLGDLGQATPLRTNSSPITIGSDSTPTSSDGNNPCDKISTFRFCLMTSSGSHADFHIDCGGSSAFYHICKGEMGIYLVRPTKANIATFVKWNTAPSESREFFGDLVDVCHRCTLTQGDSLYIPSGWIYGTFATQNSIAVGTNFLTTFQLPAQLQSHRLEEATNLPSSLQFPKFLSCLWAAALHYATMLGSNKTTKQNQPLSSITKSEHDGLTQLVEHLRAYLLQHSSPKNAVPSTQSMQQIRYHACIPHQVQDPAGMLQRLDERLNQISFPCEPQLDAVKTEQNVTKGKKNVTTVLKRRKFKAVVPTSNITGVDSQTTHLIGSQIEAQPVMITEPQSDNPRSSAETLEATPETSIPLTKTVVRKGKKGLVNSTATSGAANEAVASGEYVRCAKCKGYFTKKGLGPHQKRCVGKAHPRYAKPRVVLTAGTNTPANDSGKKHRSSCHRCGNLRPQVVACPECPVIFCRRCSVKMVEEYTVSAFDQGCPVCKLLCCCSNRNPTTCNRIYHCYKKCKAQRKNK